MYLYDRNTYCEVKEGVSYTYDHSNTIDTFNDKTENVVYQMPISNELDEYLLYLAIAVYSLDHHEVIRDDVKVIVRKFIENKGLEQYSLELLDEEIAAIQSDLYRIVTALALD